jgi:hypothetical protein
MEHQIPPAVVGSLNLPTEKSETGKSANFKLFIKHVLVKRHTDFGSRQLKAN